MLAGKTILVTGATRGIGEMLAVGLTRHGAHVELVARSAALLDDLVERLGPERVSATVADLSTEEGVDAVVNAVSGRHGHLDALVNNAATSRITPIDSVEHELATWDRIFRLNVAVPFVLTVRLLPLLARARTITGDAGRVVNIGSIDGLRPPEHDAFAYAASKAALHHLTQMLAPQLARRDVLVNALALSAFRTRLSEERLDGVLPHMTAANPLGRLGEPDDIVGIVAFLCSAASAFVNGAVIPLDGGMRNRTLPVHALARELDADQFARIVGRTEN